MIAAIAHGAVKSELVEYSSNGVTFEGYVAWDDAIAARRPGVLVVHEWTGLGDHVRGNCDSLATLGYVAFGADIYGKGVRPTGPEEAGKEAGKYKGDRALMRSRAQAALRALRDNPHADTNRVAVIGYCFGGTVALELARSGADIRGAVCLHGHVDTPEPADAKNVRGKVLVLLGADDPYIPKESIAAFEQEMRVAGVDWQLVSYGGAVHSFTNSAAGNDNSKGAAFNANANRRSWEAMRGFFKEIFR
jgi:dienelactone hydrolase